LRLAASERNPDERSDIRGLLFPRTSRSLSSRAHSRDALAHPGYDLAARNDGERSARTSPRHCEELLRRSNPVCTRVAGLLRGARNDVEGLYATFAPSLRGALATKQSSLALWHLDCFAELAVTLRSCALNAGADHAAAQNQFKLLRVRNGAPGRTITHRE
jgi:hypothetical protein